MPRCFVIQPFDKDKFDQRYEDTFKPGIEDAGFEAYRVDRDHGVDIPIDTIEREIREAAVCLADITTDNPNVWYEVGYAFACGTPVCLICSDERLAGFPFDIQHRNVLRYQTKSKSAFEKLAKDIEQRLKAMRPKAPVPASTIHDPAMDESGKDIDEHEMTILCTLLEELHGGDGDVSLFELVRIVAPKRMPRASFGLAMTSLRARGFVNVKPAANYQGESYEAVSLSQPGRSYLLQNPSRVRTKGACETRRPPQEDDEIPF